jgi:hypothetical protein
VKLKKMYIIAKKIKESDYGVDFGESGMGHVHQNGGLLTLLSKTNKKNKYKKKKIYQLGRYITDAGKD